MSVSTSGDNKRAFGLMSAVAANLDRLRSSIDALRQLHDRWPDGSGTIINLIAQLSSLKANLGEMQDWMNYAINEMHPQLLNDLNMLMTSCSLLMRNLDGLTAQMRQPDHDKADWALKLKFRVGSRTMTRLRGVAKRQTDAVSLLLAACKTHTTAQRKILLHKSRQIRKEDASSLNTLVRTSRVNGQAIKALTQMSRMIQWFRLLFYIKLLGKAPEEPPTEEDYLTAAAAMRSDAIDRQLESDELNLRRETKLVLVGQPNSGKELIMRQMKVIYAEGYPIAERYQYRVAVRSTVRLLIHSIIDLLKDTGVPLNEDLTQDFAVLLHEIETSDMSHLTPAAVTATRNIWNSSTFSTLYIKNFEIDFPQYAPYFAESIVRIASDDYVPSEADIIRLNQSAGGIKELRFDWDELGVHLFNISGFIPDQFRKRWFHQLENATALIYSVDVSTYDRPYLGQSTESQLLDDFATFESYANSPKFAGASIILLLNNFTRFREKLPHSPLETFFPDYNPPIASPGLPRSATSAQYILRRFKAVNRARLSIYSFWVDLDMSDNTHLYAALKKTLLHIQQRKARSEVWSEGSGGGGGRDSARGHRREWSGTVTSAKSGKSSTVKSKGSDVGLVSQFSNHSR
ncbi:guanine nucleotide-binding protein-like protein alpha-3 subunit [Paraphaeosphaeria sporulosa]|uniref:Guanine nucleotide-binding protein-like protein alpha-3 subunit n=1 Tax=Paraphaeosphaeria sporulosa TaxID=1460663 RepID=A0A177D026_9PLEO|nr:guanine nucleotide-binding protein-like protein alpha-3 subunit [Paraphaeosphaeria sporulosa]OAG12299.1 guanine nucleotide-binding protein-like protein alpha-3 subunit [Paraphaeosphaeria sporulosa]